MDEGTPVLAICPECRQVVVVDAGAQVGNRISCPNCGKVVLVATICLNNAVALLLRPGRPCIGAVADG